MKILFERNTAEDGKFSPKFVHDRIFDALAQLGHVVETAPTHSQADLASVVRWINGRSNDWEVYLGRDPILLQEMRQRGWRGTTIWMALGDLSHGASRLRTAAPHLFASDIVWVASRSDQILGERLFAHGFGPRFVLAPYLYDDCSFAPISADDRIGSRKQLGLTESNVVATYIGRLALDKNIFALLEVFARAFAHNDELRLLLVGRWENLGVPELGILDIDYEERVVSRIEKLGVSGAVKIIPWVESAQERRRILGASDVYASCSLALGEDFGIALAEAQAMGLPVIATAWGGYKETVMHGVTGLLASTWISEAGFRFNSSAMTSDLIHLSQDRDCRHSMGLAASEHAQHFRFEDFRNRILQLLKTSRDVSSSSPPKCRLSVFGERLQSRFYLPDGARNHIGVRVRFKSPKDADFVKLVEPYTSDGTMADSFKIDSSFLLNACLVGRCVGRYFVSEDPLCRMRFPLSTKESSIIERIHEYNVTEISLDELDAARSLVALGLVHQVPE